MLLGQVNGIFVVQRLYACKKDQGCVGFAFKEDGGTFPFYSNGEKCTNDCTKKEWISDRLLIKGGSGNGKYQCYVKKVGDSEWYRFSREKLRHYPNDSIALSWDPNKDNYISINCAGISKGLVMPPKEGAAVKCAAGDSKFYRSSREKLRHYPNDSIALIWDPNKENYIYIDCTGIKIDPTMLPKPAEGSSLKCRKNQDNPPRFLPRYLTFLPLPLLHRRPDYGRLVHGALHRYARVISGLAPTQSR